MIAQIARSRHTRLPVYREDLDNIVGMLHVTDVVQRSPRRRAPIDAVALAREALTVPETLNADDLLGGNAAEARARSARHR